MMTLEGIMAALLLLVVTYTLFQSSLIVSPLWSEFSDAQLKQIAYDTLRVLDGDPSRNDTLKGMLIRLDSSFKPNDEFVKAVETLVKPANFRVEIYWVNGSRVESRVLVDNKPTPEAVAASRFVVIESGELSQSSPFYRGGINDVRSMPIVIEVRLILWRA